MIETIPKSRSRKVDGYVKRVLALEANQKLHAERYERHIRSFDARRDGLMLEVATRVRALIGGQAAQARRILREIRNRGAR